MGTLAKKALYNLTVLLNLLSSFFNRNKKLHNARFARIDELSTLLASHKAAGTSLLLGTTQFDQTISVQPTKTRRELGNALIVAPTRGGKGLLATSQLLTWKGSVIVNDIKGELFNQTAGYRSTLGRVYVIDPTGIGNQYDPLTGKDTEDALLSSAAQLLYRPDEGEGAIFTERATVMLTQLFLAAREEEQPPLPYVRQMVRAGLPAAATRLSAISSDLATQFPDVEYDQANLSDRFLLSSWGTLSARMRPLLTDTVIRSLAGSDFNPGDIMRGTDPTTIYLRWPERDLLALSPLVRLLWGTLIDDLITTYDTENGENCHPVLFLIDEAGRTAIPSLSDHATTVAGRGISLWIAVQSLSQLETVYGRPRARTLRDNMETQLYYRPSDQDTAEFLERCLGRRSEYAHSETRAGEGEHTSQALSEQPIPLMTAQEIKQLTDEEIIGFHRRLPPFRARRMDWRRFPILQQRRLLSAPRLTALPELKRLPRTDWKRTELISGYLDPDHL